MGFYPYFLLKIVKTEKKYRGRKDRPASRQEYLTIMKEKKNNKQAYNG